jgi:putative transposase
MKEQGLRPKQSQKFRVTTDSKHNMPVAPNLLNRQFVVLRTDTVRASDITYIHTREGWLYLAVVMDLYSSRVVGWAMNNRIKRRLVMDALKMAKKSRTPINGMLFHSDRGSQYVERS